MEWMQSRLFVCLSQEIEPKPDKYLDIRFSRLNTNYLWPTEHFDFKLDWIPPNRWRA